MGSSRLPGKVLLDLAGSSVLSRVVLRSLGIGELDVVAVVTSTLAREEPIIAACRDAGWPCYRGSESDVLDRYYRAAIHFKLDDVVRITADNPFVCQTEASRVVAHHLRRGNDYTHNLAALGSGMPIGTGVEVFSFAALERSWRDGTAPQHREHVNQYVWENSAMFAVDAVVAPAPLERPELRLTLDTSEDLHALRRICEVLPDPLVPLGEVISVCKRGRAG